MYLGLPLRFVPDIGPRPSSWDSFWCSRACRVPNSLAANPQLDADQTTSAPVDEGLEAATVASLEQATRLVLRRMETQMDEAYVVLRSTTH
jgi:hypothetical protein